MKNRKGLEFSFTWLFAIIVGAVILVLAIYAATKIIGSGQTETGTASAKEIGVLLNPLETSFEDEVSISLSIATDTRIYNRCDLLENRNFGSQKISTSRKSFGKFSERSIEVSFPNKYIFSSEFEEGKEFYIFSKPFDFPFKVADLIYLSSSNKKYCFINPPERIEGELQDLEQENLLMGNCSEAQGMIKVCFGSTGCDINVNDNFGYVEKSDEKGRFYFETDALMYAAIFSEKDIYECHVKRLMLRAEELTDIYGKKVSLLSQRDCNPEVDMSTFGILLDGYSNSSDFQSGQLFDEMGKLNQENGRSTCQLW